MLMHASVPSHTRRALSLPFNVLAELARTFNVLIKKARTFKQPWTLGLCLRGRVCGSTRRTKSDHDNNIRPITLKNHL